VSPLLPVKLIAAIAPMPLVVAVLSIDHQAADAAPGRFVSGWIQGTAGEALTTLSQNGAYFRDVSPFWYEVRPDGAVVLKGNATSSTGRNNVVNAARAGGARVIPSVTDAAGPTGMESILGDSARRAALVDSLTRTAVDNGYDGMDVEFEGFAFDAESRAVWATTIGSWQAFVAELGNSLRGAGKEFTLTVPPSYNSLRNGTSGYWVYDYYTMAAYADRIRIMAYDEHVGTPGSIGGLPFATRISEYAVTMIPAYKVQLGVAQYGRDWVVRTDGVCPPTGDPNAPPGTQSLTARAAADRAVQRGVAPVWDSTQAERTYTYTAVYSNGTVACTQTRTVWYSDADSALVRLGLVGRFGLSGIVYWHVGAEDRGFFAAVDRVDLSPYSPAVVPVEQVRAFVAAAYRDLLGREVDPSGLAFWTERLRLLQTSRGDLAAQLAASPEYIRTLLTRYYLDTLGREPDPSGLAYWTDLISRRVFTEADVAARFYASPEYQLRTGDVAGWVRDLYNKLLLREPDPAGLAFWMGRAQQDRVGVAYEFYQSEESRQLRVRSLYMSLLDREVDPAGLSHWPAVILVRGDLALAGFLVGSDEYFIRAQG